MDDNVIQTQKNTSDQPVGQVSPVATSSTAYSPAPTEPQQAVVPKVVTHAAAKASGGRIQAPVFKSPVEPIIPGVVPTKTDLPVETKKIEEAVAVPVSSVDIPTPVQPISAPASKEQEPGAAPLPDVAKMTESEIVDEEKAVESELEKMIVQSPQDKPLDLPKEIKNIGAALANEDTLMPDVSLGNGAFPMTYPEAIKTNKISKVKESIKWISALIIYHWKKMRSKPDDTGGSAFG